MSDGDRTEISDEKIAGLLRLTGPRPAVPADRSARVKAAVHAYWRGEVAGRSKRKTLWTVAALAAVVTVAVAVGFARGWRPGGPPPAGIAARIEVGSATARKGEDVRSGSEINTSGADRLAIRMASGHSVRLDLDTRVRVLSRRAVALYEGAVYVDSGGPDALHGPGGESIEIRTPAGEIHEMGTQFEVRIIDAAVRVRVREGAVSMDLPTGGLEVQAGRELEIGGEGGARRGDVPTTGAPWAWIGEVAPMMEIEGRTLREFLDWVGRERGLEIRFAGAEPAASASNIRLNGSIDGMTLDQALESVLLTCRMGHRIDGNILFVEPLAGPRGSS
jgi:ferric-dicitrate binding protein FerR (iron transport regulator)